MHSKYARDSIDNCTNHGRVSAVYGDYLAISYINLRCGALNCIYTCSTVAHWLPLPLTHFPSSSLHHLRMHAAIYIYEVHFGSARFGLVRHYDSIKYDALALGFFNCFSITCQSMVSCCPSPFPRPCTGWPELISRRIINVACCGVTC